MITINIIALLKVLGLSFLITNFEPIKWQLDKLADGQIKWNLFLLTGCLKCFSFWTSLIWFQNIWFSIFVFFIAGAISNNDTYIFYTKKIKNNILEWWKKKKINYYHTQMEKIIQKIEEEK